jgi:hypothetical protein
MGYCPTDRDKEIYTSIKAKRKVVGSEDEFKNSNSMLVINSGL